MITITREIDSLLFGFSSNVQQAILDMAWEACCDGQLIAHYCQCNPDEGEPCTCIYEELQEDMELQCIKDAIAIARKDNQ